MFALGGRAFTKSIADSLELPFPRAEALKVDYSRGIPVERHDEIAAAIANDITVWSAGVELVLEELAANDLLPARIYLCGGGSLLPEIAVALRDERFWKRLPFSRPPEVLVIHPSDITKVRDETGLLIDPQDVTPMGLAFQAIELQGEGDALNAALRRVLRAMKV